MRIERIPSATIVLMTEDYINFYEKDSKLLRYAYYSSDKGELKACLLRAIKLDKPIDLLIERLQKGKEFDYVVDAVIYSS